METRNKIVKEAESWIRTPFMGHTGVKGLGVDCVHLVAAVYVAAGVLKAPVEFPRYTLGAGSHLESSLVVDSVVKTGRFCLVDNIQPGDMIGFRCGRVIHHVGIATSENEFIHCYQGAKVCKSRLDAPPWSTRVKAIWRPV